MIGRVSTYVGLSESSGEAMLRRYVVNYASFIYVGGTLKCNR